MSLRFSDENKNKAPGFIKKAFSAVTSYFKKEENPYTPYAIDILEAPLTAKEFLALDKDIIFTREIYRIEGQQGCYMGFEHQRKGGGLERVFIHTSEAKRVLENHIDLTVGKTSGSLEDFTRSLRSSEAFARTINIQNLAKALKEIRKPGYTSRPGVNLQ